MKLANPGSDHFRLSDSISLQEKQGFLKSEKMFHCNKLGSITLLVYFNRDGDENSDNIYTDGGKGFKKRQMSAVLSTSLFVSTSIMRALRCCPLVSSIIHSFASTESLDTYHHPAKRMER